MFWAERTHRIAALALLLLVAFVIADAALETAAVGDANQFDRGDVEGALRDIHDNETLFYAGNAVGIFVDGVLLLAVATALFQAFRSRSQTLATLTFAGLVGAAVLFLASDAAAITTGFLAADFVEGGAGGIAAGDAATLETARAVVVLWGIADFAGLTLLSLGILALGVLLASAPEAELNPPRWLGALAAASAVAMLLSWLVMVDEATGFALAGVGMVATLLFLISLGGWLLLRAERQAGVRETRAATA